MDKTNVEIIETFIPELARMIALKPEMADVINKDEKCEELLKMLVSSELSLRMRIGQIAVQLTD